MSSENEDQVLLKSPDESKPEPQKKSKLSYTRDFLLSLSKFDVCKKLPNGFDASILSEFGDSSSTTFERQRNSGSLSLHSSKRGEYGSQNRLESASNYARGNQGRWDTRSSGSSDKDIDLQSDRESVLQGKKGKKPRRSCRGGTFARNWKNVTGGIFPPRTSLMQELQQQEEDLKAKEAKLM